MEVYRTPDGFEYAKEKDYIGEDFIKYINSFPCLSREELDARLKAVRERIAKMKAKEAAARK